MSTVIIIDCHCQICSVQPWETKSCNQRRVPHSASRKICILIQERMTKKRGEKEDEAKCRWLFIMSTTLWASRAKRKMGVGELNKLLFIEELNAVEYFSASGEVAKYLPMKSTQHTHAKMKRTAVSL